MVLAERTMFDAFVLTDGYGTGDTTQHFTKYPGIDFLNSNFSTVQYGTGTL